MIPRSDDYFGLLTCDCTAAVFLHPGDMREGKAVIIPTGDIQIGYFELRIDGLGKLPVALPGIFEPFAHLLGQWFGQVMNDICHWQEVSPPGMNCIIPQCSFLGRGMWWWQA